MTGVQTCALPIYGVLRQPVHRRLQRAAQALSAGVTLDAGALSAAAQRDTSGAALSAGATAGTTSGASQAGGNARIEIALNITGSGVSKSDALELQGATLEGVKAALMQLGFELGGV